MKNRLLFCCCAAPSRGPAQPPIRPSTRSIFMSADRVVVEDGRYYKQKLSVVIDRRKCELAEYGATNWLLAIGDYRAKLIKDEHRGTYDSYRIYELLLPDNKTRQFRLVGETE
jgi:hypothetical protein